MVAGVSIGAGVLLIALTAGLVFFLFRRRRKDAAGAATSKEIIEEPPQYVQNPSYSPSDFPKEAPGDSYIVEMPGYSSAVTEVPADNYRVEAPGHFKQPQELPADYGGATFNGRNFASQQDWRSKPLPAPYDNGR
jgi:hypothetical protein